MKPNIKVQEVELPTRLKRRCDEHIKTLNQIKETIDEGRREVFTDLFNLADEIYETARLGL